MTVNGRWSICMRDSPLMGRVVALAVCQLELS